MDSQTFQLLCDKIDSVKEEALARADKTDAKIDLVQAKVDKMAEAHWKIIGERSVISIVIGIVIQFFVSKFSK